ncbi:MAG: hypothetical protein S4CHLAM123_05670 [Chlamydiales bacterium]|nr:hypothetical protein [Chlamydiales bacterium]
MIQVIRSKFNADYIGMASSSLCLVHCMMTLFIFIAQACTMSCCASSPRWWRAIDFLFLVISFVAVYFAAKNTSKRWVRTAFYLLFSLLSVFIINHHAHLIALPIQFNYLSAALLFLLHLYNRKYCKCPSKCCES